jgi:hypothetical protein
MMFRKINAVYSQIHTKQINTCTLCGQKVELLNVKLVVHIVNTGSQKVNHLRPSGQYLYRRFNIQQFYVHVPPR